MFESLLAHHLYPVFYKYIGNSFTTNRFSTELTHAADVTEELLEMQAAS